MTSVRREVHTLTPACVSGQSKQHVGTKTRMSVCVPTIPAAGTMKVRTQRKDMVVSHQRLALCEITSRQHFDMTVGKEKKAGQTADALQAATYLSSNNKPRKLHVQL